ncbi:MAG: NADH-quinone oxidoreductase subunit M [Thiotrichaceae bacterium]|nr:NADH-quinone oxidoreductase subunit M [Thiotrichaceae bacterium]
MIEQTKHVFSMHELSWTHQIDWPILAVLQLLPLFAAIFVWIFRKKPLLFHGISLVAVISELVIAIDLYRRFNIELSSLQYAEQSSWLPGYHVAVDGLSLIFVLLTAFIFLMLVIYSFARKIQELHNLLPTILVIQAVLMGLFLTMNLLWFIVLSAIELTLVAYIMLHWASSPEKELARSRYINFMFVGLLLLLAGVMILAWNYADVTGEHWGFDLLDLVKIPIPSFLQSIIFFLLFYGLAIRTPIFPFHGWLPIFTTHGNVALAPAIILGLKVGIYGMLRFVFTLTPEAIDKWHYHIVAIAVAGVFYSAILALMQNNLRRLLAFAVISHTSILVIGLFSLGHTGFQGSVSLSITFGLAIVGLVFMVGFVFRRSNSLLMSRLGGLFETIPIIGVTFLISGLAIVGMPGTPGFEAVHLVLEAAIEKFGAPITVIAALGNVVAAGFLLWAFQRAFLTPKTGTISEAYWQETTPLERLTAGLLLLVIVVAGFHSEPWLKLIDMPLQNIYALYNKG